MGTGKFIFTSEQLYLNLNIIYERKMCKKSIKQFFGGVHYLLFNLCNETIIFFWKNTVWNSINIFTVALTNIRNEEHLSLT